MNLNINDILKEMPINECSAITKHFTVRKNPQLCKEFEFNGAKKCCSKIKTCEIINVHSENTCDYFILSNNPQEIFDFHFHNHKRGETSLTEKIFARYEKQRMERMLNKIDTEKNDFFTYWEEHFIYLIYIEFLDNLLEENIKIKPKNNINKHFTRESKMKELKKLFDNLIKGGYILENTLFSHFCYVLDGIPIPDNEVPFALIQWIDNQILLACFIRDMFSDIDNDYWEISKSCFQIQGKSINIITMKKNMSDIKCGRRGYPRRYSDLRDIMII